MKCENQVIHTVKAGDTLYSLAIRYNTTVSKLLELNPNVDVYNLQIGSTLLICPGFRTGTPVPPIGTVPPGTSPVQPVPPIGTIPTQPVPPIGTIPCSDKFRELISMTLCWLAEQYGEDKARSIVQSIAADWDKGNYPC